MYHINTLKVTFQVRQEFQNVKSSRKPSQVWHQYTETFSNSLGVSSYSIFSMKVRPKGDFPIFENTNDQFSQQLQLQELSLAHHEAAHTSLTIN